MRSVEIVHATYAKVCSAAPRGRNPVKALSAKAKWMPPPVDLDPLHAAADGGKPAREKKTIFVETRDTDVELINAALGIITRRAEKFRLVTVGPVEKLADTLPRTTIPETDEIGQCKALLAAGVFISARHDAAFDYHAVRALHAGCWPVVPASGIYPELLPPAMHSACLYEPAAGKFANQIQNAWQLQRPEGYETPLQENLHRYDAVAACKSMDQRFEELASK